MGTRRKQASAERRNQIIDAALQVFAEKGFQATTNRDIAAAASINSPGLIYHYFESQEDLFRAVLQERTPILRMTISESQELMTQPPQVVLPRIAQTLLETASDPTTQSLMRLIMGEALRQPPVFDILYEGGPIHMLTFLYGYLEHWMEQGVLRRIDPGVAVRSFLGPFFLYLFSTLLLGMNDPHAPTPEILVEEAVENFLRGMAP